MKSICAWCKKELDSSEFDSYPDDFITHGMCASCYDKVLLQIGVDLYKYLDILTAPVLLVDSAGIVRTANGEARKLLKKDLKKIEGNPGGDVFECAHSRLPGGCGNTIHCSGCTIRRTVMETHETGKGQHRVPAYLNQISGESTQRICLYISTEKVGDFVFLRIDEVKDSTPDV